MRHALFVALLILLSTFAFLPLPSRAQPQPTYVAVSAIASLASPGGDVTVTLPAHVAYDVFVLQVLIQDTANSITVSGWTAVTGSPFDRGATARRWIFWYRTVSASNSNPLVDTDGTTGDIFAQVAQYRNAVSTGTPIEAVGAARTGTADPAPVATVTTLTANALVILALSGEDNNNNPGPGVATATNPTTFVEHYTDSATGADAMFLFAEETRLTAGASGTVNYDFNVANPVGWGGMALSLKPQTGGAGADGFNSLVAWSYTSKAATSGQCPYGGTTLFLNVTSGLDDGLPSGTPRDNVLQAGEIDATTSMTWSSCTGAQGPQGNPGADGADGYSWLFVLVNEGAGVNCNEDGVKITNGLDLDRDTNLDASEITNTTFICGVRGRSGDNGNSGGGSGPEGPSPPPDEDGVGPGWYSPSFLDMRCENFLGSVSCTVSFKGSAGVRILRSSWYVGDELVGHGSGGDRFHAVEFTRFVFPYGDVVVKVVVVLDNGQRIWTAEYVRLDNSPLVLIAMLGAVGVVVLAVMVKRRQERKQRHAVKEDWRVSAFAGGQK